MGVRKNPEEVEKMRESARILSGCLDFLVEKSQPGTSGKELDLLAEEYIRDHGAIPAFKGYELQGPPYPASICFSRNHHLVHGIPSSAGVVQEGDVITIDCGLSLDGWFADAARLFGVGNLPEEDRRLIEQTHRALSAGIRACTPGSRLGDVCHAIQMAIVKSDFFNVVHFCGHGIGRDMHEAPQVPNFGRPNTGLRLRPGMVFCLEPMLIKKRDTKLGVLPDGWTIVTQDGTKASHVEHMVLVTEKEPEILTA